MKRWLAHFLVSRSRDADEETTTADGRDNLARAVRAHDEAHVGHVLLHRAAERGLRVARERVRLVDNDDWRSAGTGEDPKLTFELLLCVQVDLLRLRNLLENVLNDDAVVHADIGRRELNVVVGLHDVDIELAVRGGHEDALVDAELGVRAEQANRNSPSRHQDRIAREVWP